MSNLYCVLKIKDKQYFLTQGDVVKTHPVQEKEPISILLLKDEGDLFLGSPEVEKGGVVLDLIGVNRIKTDVRRFKSKSRYRKNKSHSQEFSVLKVVKISSKLTGVKINIVEAEEKSEIIDKPVKTVLKKVRETEEKKVTTIETLDFSPRILAALSKNKIKTVSQLSKLTKEEITSIEGLGKKSVEDILKKLGK